MRSWLACLCVLVGLAGVMPPALAEDAKLDPAALRQRVYDLVLEGQAKTKVTSGNGPGASYIGRSDAYSLLRDAKALAACIDWSGGALERLRIRGYATIRSAYAPRMSEMRKDAMDTCAKWQSQGCQCQMVDENGQNALVVPDSFAQRVAATPRSPELVAQIAYDQIMAKKASVRLTPPPEGGTATIRDYWGRKSGKALAVCLGWTGDTIADMRIGGSSHHYTKAPAADEATRAAALKGCQKFEKPDCHCQLVDQDEKNVLDVPADFTRRILAKFGN